MTQQEYQNRRQALLAKMAPGSAAIFFAAPEATRSADSEYPYRQNSDFSYLTGFNEPEAVLILVKSDETHNPQCAVQPGARFNRRNLVWPPLRARGCSRQVGG